MIVQSCRISTLSRTTDQNGNPSKVTPHTVGTGKVSVFRDGRRIDGTWTRGSVRGGTHLKDARGQPITLAPGGAWFVLVATRTSAS